VDADRQRIDKWLWHARVVRTRSAAAGLVEAGHVRVNGERVRAPAHQVRTRDVLTVALDRSVRSLRVLRFSERRGGAADAEKLYESVDPGPQRPETPE
jgi:ribosome-associated heat shock protein Hsp15